MKLLFNHFIFLAFAVGMGWPCRMAGQDLGVIGVSALRAVTTNLNGSGIRVAQPEANLNGTNTPYAFEVDPVSAGQPISLFTYRSRLGLATNYPNAVGIGSGHADQVAALFFGFYVGVATNVAHVDSYDADYYLDTFVFSNVPAPSAVIVNQSYTFGTMPGTNQMELDAVFDDYAVSNGVLFVSAANNGGPVCVPATGYNCISVGAYGGSSSIGPTVDNGRCKPEIVAPAGATSFSTPQVSGAAAVLMQAALRGDGGIDTNAAFDLRTIKALLLNGAVKPLGWTNSNAFPLDARYGAGMLNVLNAYKQMTGGKRPAIATNAIGLNLDHPPSHETNTVFANQAWDFAAVTTGATNDAVVHYVFNVTNVTAAATLVWNRQFGQTNTAQLVNDLDLYLYRVDNSNLVARSDSYVNNVEHLWVTNLPAGRYDLQVVKYGGTNVVSAAETYALAWQFVPPPTLTLAGSETNLSLAWPLYPGGYGLEARTNLTSGFWSSNNLPAPAISVNGSNNTLLNKTNASQFFRLRSPSF